MRNQLVSSCNFMFSNYCVDTVFFSMLLLAVIQGLIFLIYFHVEDAVELLKYQTQLTICLKENSSSGEKCCQIYSAISLMWFAG